MVLACSVARSAWSSVGAGVDFGGERPGDEGAATAAGGEAEDCGDLEGLGFSQLWFNWYGVFRT